MKLMIIFTLASLAILQTTRIVQGSCEIELRECQQFLDPIYQQPAELLRRFQNCSLSLYEEQLKLKQCEIKRDELLEKTKIPYIPDISQKPIGVEGRWVQKIASVQIPQGAVQNLNEGDLIAWPNYLVRTWIGENTVPCRTNFNAHSCWLWWDGKVINKYSYEFLVGNYSWRWTNSSVPIPNNALIGGYRVIPGTDARETLYVGRAIHDEFIKHNFTTNRLLLGYIYGQTRELVHFAWESVQRKTTYQILVKP